MKIDFSIEELKEMALERLQHQQKSHEYMSNLLLKRINELKNKDIEIDGEVFVSMLISSDFDINKAKEAYSRYMLGEVVLERELNNSVMNDLRGWQKPYQKETN